MEGQIYLLRSLKKSFCILFLLCAISTKLCAQVVLTDSNLPIVIITTDNEQEIQDEPKILATMKIIYSGPGERNFVSDQNTPAALNYNGRIGIEIRGSSSQILPKKQYSFTTLLSDNVSNNNVELVGMPKENDWVLNGLAFDAALIRDYISYNLSRQIGEYAPRTQFCEVIINGNYTGLYILQEKIKVGPDRVDVSKISPADNTLPDLSGGYITKSDKVAGEDVPSWFMSSYLGTNDVSFIHEFPKPSNITSTQNQYIKSVFEKLSITANNPSLSAGYPSVIDVPSFVDFMLINELAANADAYQFSTYFHKDKNGKLRAGPIWDLNLTYGNDLLFWGLDRSKTDTWQFDNSDNNGAKFWKDLFDNSIYKCYLSKRWHELTQIGQPLNLEILKTFIDETKLIINEASIREQATWGTVDLAEMEGIKSFIEARITWMNLHLGPFTECSDVVTPALVITKINYHPDTNDEFKDSNDQEFIEILNNSDEVVDLTGIYFSGIGIQYQFRAGAKLPPNGVIQLGNKFETFNKLYGYVPYGEFTRNLSNSAQKIILADGFGNIIDEVDYTTEAPWPNADGNGSYLKLTDPNLDNNIGSNWIASADSPSTNVVVGVDEDENQDIEFYPNPTETVTNIKAPGTIELLQVHDMQGRLLINILNAPAESTLDMRQFANGIYLLKITTGNRTMVRKVMKK